LSSEAAMTELPDTPTNETDRWTMLRDLAVLQVKLIVDGLRDLILVPASLIAGVISLMSGSDGKPGPQFYHLLGLGKQTEQWIDLFGAFRNAPQDLERLEPFPDARMDDIVSRIETFVVDEHARGGMTAQAKERFDKALDAMQRKR
jgi:hypothetical protein